MEPWHRGGCPVRGRWLGDTLTRPSPRRSGPSTAGSLAGDQVRGRWLFTAGIPLGSAPFPTHGDTSPARAPHRGVRAGSNGVTFMVVGAVGGAKVRSHPGTRPGPRCQILPPWMLQGWAVLSIPIHERKGPDPPGLGLSQPAPSGKHWQGQPWHRASCSRPTVSPWH